MNLITFNNTESYMSNIANIPVLSKEEELELANDLFFNKNIESAKALILSHLRYVAYIAFQYKGYKMPMEDLIQEGNIGLMKAINNFDPRKGVRLISYATIYIKERIHEFVIKNFRIGNVATTKSQRKLFFNLKREKNGSDGSWLTANEIERISKKLNVSKKDVETMESRMYSNDLYFDQSYNEESDSFFELEDKTNLFEKMESEAKSDSINESLYQGLEKLKDREKDIIISRWINEEKATLEDLSLKYSISRERVRQIEKSALLKLKEMVK